MQYGLRDSSQFDWSVHSVVPYLIKLELPSAASEYCRPQANHMDLQFCSAYTFILSGFVRTEYLNNKQTIQWIA